MDVVANAGAVGRRIVGTEHGQRGAAPERGIDHERQQVGLGLVGLAERAVRVRARGIEVAQCRPAQPVCDAVRLECVLDGELRCAVRIDRLRACGLGDRNLVGHAVDRGRRREQERADLAVQHAIEEREALRQVAVEVEAGLLHRLADLDLAGEVSDRLDAMVAQEARDELAVGDVAAHDLDVRGELRRRAGREIVEHDDLAAAGVRGAREVRPHVAAAARDEDAFACAHGGYAM